MKSHALSMNTFTISALALCLASTVISDELNSEVIVHVTNGLKPGSSPLSLDCQSGEAESGFLELPVGEEIKLQFSSNDWAPARFYCYFSWDDKTINLDLYTSKYQVSQGNLWFMADEEGVLVKSDEHQSWTRQCPWGDPTPASRETINPKERQYSP